MKRVLAATTLVAATLLPAYAATLARADTATACDEGDQDSPSAAAGRPFESLRIGEVQDWFGDRQKGALAGDGVVVAVLDSGVNPVVPLVGPQVPAGGIIAGYTYFHGTAVAGIIAGPPDGDNRVGIAPGAKILDVKIYDGVTADDGTVVSGVTVAAGLRAVLAALPTTNVKVVNLSVAVPDTPGIAGLVQELWDKGVVVVASSGNRPGSPDDPLLDDFDQFAAGENAAGRVFPAGYDHVVAATTTLGGLPAGSLATDYILQSTAIDVAVPTSGALSYSAATGQSCVLKRPATSWAAAEVSGILAALASAYPKDDPAELVTRLESTAAGRDDVRSPLTGAGVAQPYAALTRPMDVKADGSYDRTEPVQSQERAQAPTEEVDPLVSTRQDMVWFAIVGGGVLVLALVLRPVLARRRSR